jgi:quinolinate synthase
MTAKPLKNPQDIAERIDELRGKLGSGIHILGHHYQDHTVIRHVDQRGDSLELARKVPDISAEHILFCGVYFMAESAALLAAPGQKVHLPEPSATCVMAQMAPAALLDTILSRLSHKRKVVPLAYVNSSVAVKAVAGKYGGSVCTSANATTMLRWALDKGDAVLFLPDKNLAWNTADLLDIPADRRHMLDIRAKGDNIDLDAAHRAQLLMWPGCCAIHARFNTRQIQSRKAEVPGLRVVVHPECSPQVVAASDACGSTSFILRYVDNTPYGSSIAIGTEINLVERLAAKHIQRMRILPLLESECSHMDRTKPRQLLASLEAISARRKNPSRYADLVSVDPNIAPDAHLALQRMLEACA